MVDCIVMAGGRGERFGGPSKPLVEVCGLPMIVWVVRAASPVCRRIFVAYTDHTRDVESMCSGALGRAVCVKTSGRGFVPDLKEALTLVSYPALVLPADTPLIRPWLLAWFLEAALAMGGDVVNLGYKDGGLTGISLLKRPSGSWATVEIGERSWALDVDTRQDLVEAEEACRQQPGPPLA